MEKIIKPNISPLEEDIEDKMRTAYLFYVTARSRHFNFNDLHTLYCSVNPVQAISNYANSINPNNNKNETTNPTTI